MIQHKTIDGVLLRDMAIAGAQLLEKNRDLVDALNVFPVPDGDTGTNMSLTMQSAIREISSKEFLRADEAAAAYAKGALRGARGNSGVITSQLLRGFSKAIAGLERITPVDFAKALLKGSEMAYKAVMKPKEGTILTVARVIAEEAMVQAQKAPDDYEALFAVIMRVGENILKKTTDMLPALKQANVVDSGGRGLLFIYAGYAAVLRGESIDDILEAAAAEADDGACEGKGEITYTYCLSFTIRETKEDVTENDLDSYRRRLNRIGDHVSVSGEVPEMRVHVHTDHPGNAIEYATELGDLVDFDLKNLRDLKRKLEGEEAPVAAEPVEEKKEPSKEYGMVTVSLGEGFTQIFRDLQVDTVVEGGQTMNPSIEDLLNAIEQTDARTVFVFPNNGNVVMAAQQAAELSSKKVFVIPTKNVAMGIAAAVAFQPDSSAEENAANMEEAAQHVKTGTVTYAVRDSEFNGVQIKQGDYIGLHNGQISYSGASVHDVAMEMMKAVVTEDDELITVYYGADTTEEDAQALADEIGSVYDHCDVECHMGGQPLYYYLISVE